MKVLPFPERRHQRVDWSLLRLWAIILGVFLLTWGVILWTVIPAIDWMVEWIARWGR